MFVNINIERDFNNDNKLFKYELNVLLYSTGHLFPLHTIVILFEHI